MARKYVVIDTNVLVSALITRNENSPTVQILRFLANGNIVPVYSEDIVKEYNEVLRRAKFKLSESLIINLLKDIMDNGLKITELADGNSRKRVQLMYRPDNGGILAMPDSNNPAITIQ